MPSNETLIAIPLELEDFQTTKQFLVRLVEKLDIILGYRGGDSFVSTSQLLAGLIAIKDFDDNTLIGLLLALEAATIQFVEDSVAELKILVDTNVDDIANLKSATTIVDTAWSEPTASAGYVQNEAQTVIDQVEDNTNKINELLAILRATEIIAT